jgi:TolA-binding protein
MQSSGVRQGKSRPADPRAQQRYYDLGLQQYSKEKYERAKESFRHVVEINASNKLGLKAQENIKKIDRILKTLNDMEKK